MRLALTPHPDTPCPAVDKIEVEVERGSAGLRLRYEVAGELDALAIPEPASPQRRDGLWRHSCFEGFFRPKGGEGYIELNFTPSRQWAAYRFEGYRSGMAELAVPSPIVSARRSPRLLEVEAQVVLDEPDALEVGLSAVIEEVEGRLSYWALRHPPGKPDFHHRHCFAAELPPAG